jgi:hypothetical protein
MGRKTICCSLKALAPFFGKKIQKIGKARF